MKSVRRHPPGGVSVDSIVSYVDSSSPQIMASKVSSVSSPHRHMGVSTGIQSPLTRRSRPGDLDSSKMHSPLRSSRLNQDVMSSAGISRQQMQILQQAHFQSVGGDGSELPAPTPGGKAKLTGILRPREYLPLQSKALQNILSKFKPEPQVGSPETQRLLTGQ